MRRLHGAAAGLLTLGVALSACSKTLTEKSVLAFVDAADQAFVDGDSNKMCDAKSKNYVQTDTEFELAEGQIVNSLAEAEAIEAERSADGARLTGKDVQINKKQLCMIAVWEGRDFTKVDMERTSIQIEVAPDGKSAVVKSHYSMQVPLFQQRATEVYGGARRQHTGTKQMETEDESVVVIEDGDIVFKSTRSVSKSFQIPKKPNARI
jgi:hypothetical protein